MTWDELAKIQSGAVSRKQLLDFGIQPRQVARLVGSNQLVRMSRGVFLARGAPETYQSSLWIAILRTGGALGFATAAHLWGAIDRPLHIDIVIDPRRRLAPGRAERLHRVIVRDDAFTTVDGLPITARDWSLLDYAGSLSIAEAVRVIDRAFQQGWLTRSDIRARLHEYPYRTGNLVLRRILAITKDGAAAESERRLQALLHSARIGGWYPNFAVRLRGRLVAVLDVAFPERLLAIEVDGLAYHSDTEAFIRDRRRQNELVALGWTVLRFTWWDLVERRDRVVDMIAQHLARPAG